MVDAARSAGADAVHPGFGFLAENADFAEAVESAGMRWVGPPPSAIRAMGDKAAARILAERLGVPVLPGYDGPDQSDPALTEAAARIGYPLLIKPSAGGGGKGMHVVRDPDRLADGLAAARREAGAAFGDERVILERLADGARHVEVQVLFDAQGHGVHLGERDCSLQRRHQKILEETPSPAVDPALRRRLTDAALALASEVGYVSAGTCEFLITDRGEPAFLEMNTRLQVEHPVTEAVTGRDLVADQLRVAAGEPLGFSQDDIVPTGHAVEVRLYAEDAEDGFLPATGRIEALRWPSGAGIRVDAGIALGTEVGSRFDPMLAKIVAHGRDRAEAFERLTAALDETVVLGVVTNLRFLRWLVRQDVVLAGEARTDTLDRIWPPDDWSDRAAIPDDAWHAAAVALRPGTRRRSVGRRLAAERAIDGAPRDRRTDPGDRHDPTLRGARVGRRGRDGARRRRRSKRAPSDWPLHPMSTEPPARRRATRPAAVRRTSIAPMPGAVLTIHAAVGAVVAAGDPVVTLEAMKMEHVVAAPNGRDRRRAPCAPGRAGRPRPGARDHRVLTARLRVRSTSFEPEVPMAHQADSTPLPGTRDELLALHRETRRRRNAAAHGSEEHKAAIELIGRIEVEVARIERAMDPPLV